MGWVVNVTTRPLYPREREPVSPGWAPRTVWKVAENLAPTEIRSPDRPARSESIYRLSYRGSNYNNSNNSPTGTVSSVTDPSSHIRSPPSAVSVHPLQPPICTPLSPVPSFYRPVHGCPTAADVSYHRSKVKIFVRSVRIVVFLCFG